MSTTNRWSVILEVKKAGFSLAWGKFELEYLDLLVKNERVIWMPSGDERWQHDRMVQIVWKVEKTHAALLPSDFQLISALGTCIDEMNSVASDQIQRSPHNSRKLANHFPPRKRQMPRRLGFEETNTIHSSCFPTGCNLIAEKMTSFRSDTPQRYASPMAVAIMEGEVMKSCISDGSNGQDKLEAARCNKRQTSLPYDPRWSHSDPASQMLQFLVKPDLHAMYTAGTLMPL
ncbi:hypothetical protein BC830DRAFT_1078981 [Chytriomyces sp. MP71]|nr:hypothetical protein BC830DRAFT_1078981 [Chytriomyces sp. MP71]